MGARVAPLTRAVVLSAGRASRLSGVNKLLVKAAGKTVLQWHERAFSGWRLDAVVRVADVVSVLRAGWQGGTLVGTDECDGPAGALRSYVAAVQLDEPIVVVFADTLLHDVPADGGDWVGVAPAPWRVWDYRVGDTWMRGVPTFEVCVGLYRFDDASALREALNALPFGTEVPMTALLREYEKKRRLGTVLVQGWQDAGDREALAKVKG
jgi:hypothetical protein